MLTDLLYRLRAFFRRNAVEGELDEELRFHFEQQVEKYAKSGLTRQKPFARPSCPLADSNKSRKNAASRVECSPWKPLSRIYATRFEVCAALRPSRSRRFLHSLLLPAVLPLSSTSQHILLSPSSLASS